MIDSGEAHELTKKRLPSLNRSFVLPLASEAIVAVAQTSKLHSRASVRSKSQMFANGPK
jgi:hypothetical protein